MTQKYVSLHNHSQGSFLDGYSDIESMVKRAVDIGMIAIAVTDHGDCNQHISLQTACDKAGIKPIYGIEAYLVDSIAKVREEKTRENSHLCVFAENQKGLENLWTISSKAYIDGRYYKPLTDWDTFAKYSEGLIVTDGCMLAYMARAILADDENRIVELIGRYAKTFGENNFFMELHTWQFVDPQSEKDIQLNADMTKINQGKVRIAKTYGIPLIVVNDAHYACEHEWENHALVWKMNTKGEDKTESGQTASWIMTDEEVIFWMSKHGISRSITEEAINNTQVIANRCNVKIEGKNRLPYMTGSAEGDLKMFWDDTEKGFKRKVVEAGLDVDLYRERLEYEAEVIIRKDFYGYFNIVADYVHWAKHIAKMLVGPARGSGAGSIIGWLRDITEVDPVKYGLLFSRFINEGRKSLPDFDIDFPQSRRQEVIQYVSDRHGEDHVALVGTLSRSSAKGIMKDLCRAMEIPYADAEVMGKIIAKFDKHSMEDNEEEEDAGPPWYEVLQKSGGDLSRWISKYPKLFQKMGEMVGNIRQSSSHASGVLISNESLYGQVPMRIKGDASKTIAVTQFENSDKYNQDISFLGWDKFDILGLRHLDTLEQARELVKKNHGIEIDYYAFGDKEYLDPAIWSQVDKGETLGVFTIETSAMQDVCKKFNARNERDIADLISVQRPGVIDAGMLEPFLDRRSGKKEVRVPHQMMSKHLESTFGVVVYQEQVIKLVQDLGGYSESEADDIRSMMGKKKVEQMALAKPEFIARCSANPEFVKNLRKGQKAEDVALKVWENLEPSAGYSFGQGHATGYAMIVCWGLWMRHYYYKEYFTALMRTDPEKVPAYVGWLRKKEVNVLPPDINDSEKNFVLTDSGIRYGITTVKDVGDAAYNEIVKTRPFESFDDFLGRVSKRGCNLKVIQNLVSIGAFDSLGVDRYTALAKLFDERKAKDRKIPDFSDDDIIAAMEKDLVGVYITKDPLDKYITFMKDLECLATTEDLDSLYPSELANIGGLVTAVRRHEAKNGTMAWITLDNKGEVFEMTMFAEKFKAYKYLVTEGVPVVCQIERLKRGCCIREFVRLDKQ